LSHEQAGETVTDIATDFDLPEEDVRWALAHETSARRMTKRARPARVCYYIDADLLGLAKISSRYEET
jgi:hypothetical protein